MPKTTLPTESLEPNEHQLWRVIKEPRKTPATKDGFLTISVRDVRSKDTIAASGLLRRWAYQAGYSLHGVKSLSLAALILKDLLFIADTELGLSSRLSRNFVAILEGTYRGDLPELTVEMHPFLIQSRVAQFFDGAAPTPEATLPAVARRMT